MRTLISSLESDSKRSTLESSSTSSSSRIVGCSSLISAPILSAFRASFSARVVCGRDIERVLVAIPRLEGGEVADLRLYARSGCSILLYGAWAHHSNELVITTFFASFGELREAEVQLPRLRLLGARAKLFRRCRTRQNPGTSLRRSMPEDSPKPPAVPSNNL